MILVLSAQHTGTWFLLELLQLHPAVRRVEYSDWPRYRPLEGDVTVLHAHLGVPTDERFPDGKYLSRERAVELVGGTDCPVLIPMRDPLRAIITRETRHPHGDHQHIVQGIAAGAELKTRFPHRVHFFPIDVDVATREARVARARALYETLDLTFPTEAEAFAHRWMAPSYNVSSPHPLKVWYDLGDWESIRDSGLATSTMTSLPEHETARDLLDHLGYDLAWNRSE